MTGRKREETQHKPSASQKHHQKAVKVSSSAKAGEKPKEVTLEVPGTVKGSYKSIKKLGNGAHGHVMVR